MSTIAVRSMREYNRLIKKVLCKDEDPSWPLLKLSNFVVALKFVQLFGDAVRQGCLEQGTEGCVDECSGGGGLCVFHVQQVRPSERLVKLIRTRGFIVRGGSMIDVSWYVEEGDVVEMCVQDMIPTASPKVVTGIGVLSGPQVKAYLTPYVCCPEGCPEISFFEEVVTDKFRKSLWVFVSRHKPKFLGRSCQRMSLDSSQLLYLRERWGGGGRDDAVGTVGRKDKKRKVRDECSFSDESLSSSCEEEEEKDEDEEGSWVEGFEEENTG